MIEKVSKKMAEFLAKQDLPLYFGRTVRLDTGAEQFCVGTDEAAVRKYVRYLENNWTDLHVDF